MEGGKCTKEGGYGGEERKRECPGEGDILQFKLNRRQKMITLVVDCQDKDQLDQPSQTPSASSLCKYHQQGRLSAESSYLSFSEIDQEEETTKTCNTIGAKQNLPKPSIAFQESCNTMHYDQQDSCDTIHCRSEKAGLTESDDEPSTTASLSSLSKSSSDQDFYPSREGTSTRDASGRFSTGGNPPCLPSTPAIRFKNASKPCGPRPCVASAGWHGSGRNEPKTYGPKPCSAFAGRQGSGQQVPETSGPKPYSAYTGRQGSAQKEREKSVPKPCTNCTGRQGAVQKVPETFGPKVWSCSDGQCFFQYQAKMSGPKPDRLNPSIQIQIRRSRSKSKPCPACTEKRGFSASEADRHGSEQGKVEQDGPKACSLCTDKSGSVQTEIDVSGSDRNKVEPCGPKPCPASPDKRGSVQTEIDECGRDRNKVESGGPKTCSLYTDKSGSPQTEIDVNGSDRNKVEPCGPKPCPASPDKRGSAQTEIDECGRNRNKVESGGPKTCSLCTDKSGSPQTDFDVSGSDRNKVEPCGPRPCPASPGKRGSVQTEIDVSGSVHKKESIEPKPSPAGQGKSGSAQTEIDVSGSDRNKVEPCGPKPCPAGPDKVSLVDSDNCLFDPGHEVEKTVCDLMKSESDVGQQVKMGAKTDSRDSLVDKWSSGRGSLISDTGRKAASSPNPRLCDSPVDNRRSSSQTQAQGEGEPSDSRKDKNERTGSCDNDSVGDSSTGVVKCDCPQTELPGSELSGTSLECPPDSCSPEVRGTGSEDDVNFCGCEKSK